jgi:LEA14-like dessication related protein
MKNTLNQIVEAGQAAQANLTGQPNNEVLPGSLPRRLGTGRPHTLLKQLQQRHLRRPGMTVPRILIIALALLALAGCATLQDRDPLQVTVAGIEPLPGQGLELRMLVKLRVQNPNDAPVDYNGLAVEMAVQGKTFATGVADARGNVPRFGETIIEIPVTVSAFRMMRQAVGVIQGRGAEKITYELKGKLNGPTFRSMRFNTRGELDLNAVAPD